MEVSQRWLLMDVIGLKKVERFLRYHADVRSQFSSWLAEAQEANWRTPADIKERYTHASFLADNRVIFNLKGNIYRLDTKIYYGTGVVLIIRMGTHAEYAKWTF